MKILNYVLRALLILLLLTPILGATGVFPGPTADLYTPSGWAFMEALINSGYVIYLIALTCAVCIVLILMGKTALAAVIQAPLSVNVICFHTFVDTGLFHPAAILGIMLFLLNAYFLWDGRKKYTQLW